MESKVFFNHGTNVGWLMKPWVEGVSRFLGWMMVGKDGYGSSSLTSES